MNNYNLTPEAQKMYEEMKQDFMRWLDQQESIRIPKPTVEEDNNE